MIPDHSAGNWIDQMTAQNLQKIFFVDILNIFQTQTRLNYKFKKLQCSHTKSFSELIISFNVKVNKII